MLFFLQVDDDYWFQSNSQVSITHLWGEEHNFWIVPEDQQSMTSGVFFYGAWHIFFHHRGDTFQFLTENYLRRNSSDNKESNNELWINSQLKDIKCLCLFSTAFLPKRYAEASLLTVTALYFPALSKCLGRLIVLYLQIHMIL